MNFHVGQKVVCVDSGTDPGKSWWGDVPSEGNIYTVRGLLISPGGAPWVFLEEICNQHRAQPDTDCGYAARRFRPLVTRKTDISIFKRMLIPAPEKVTA